MNKNILIGAVLGLGVASLQAGVIFSEDFESSGWATAAGGSLPTAGNFVNITGNVTDGSNPHGSAAGLPQGAQFKAPNNFGDDFYLGNGVDKGSVALGGLLNTTSLGLKNYGVVYWNITSLIPAEANGEISVSFDWATGDSNQKTVFGLYSAVPGYNGTGVGAPLDERDLLDGSKSTFGTTTSSSGSVSLTDFDVSRVSSVYMVFQKQGFANDTHIDNIQVSAVPEPATLGLVAMFGGGIIAIRRIMI